MRIGVINYGSGNFGSVWNCLEYLGMDIQEVSQPADFDKVDRLVLPGVGTFGQAMTRLEKHDLRESIDRDVIQRGKPFLGICVGMQILAGLGFEYEKCEGLNYVGGQVARMEPSDRSLRLPHIGWNNLSFRKSSILFDDLTEGCSFYFVHSYAIRSVSPDVVAAVADYGGDVIACVEKDNIFGVQFHPEKSQAAGLKLLANFASFN